MSRPMWRSARAVGALIALALVLPGPAAATITGGCQGEGHSSSGVGANLTTDTEWHLNRDDVAGGSATSPVPMRDAQVAAYALGFGIPIAGGTSEDGETAGSLEGVSVETYAILGHRFVIAGSASGDGQCSGRIEILLDDVNPLFTVLGGGGIILGLIGLLAVLGFSRSSGGCLNRILSALFGALGGLGAALALEQFEVLDPTQPIGLFLLVAAALLGLLTAGIFFRGDGTAATPLPARGATVTTDTEVHRTPGGKL